MGQDRRSRDDRRSSFPERGGASTQLSEAIDRYVADEVPKKRNGGMYAFTLPWWKKNLGHLRLSDVTPAVLVEHRGKLARETYTRATPDSKRSTVRGKPARQFTRSSATVNRYLANLSHVFTVARKEWHWISHSPFDGVGLLDEGPGRVRFLSDDERERLLAETAKDKQLHTLTLAALSTAARAGELWTLIWRDVDLKDGRLYLRLTKNAEPRTAWVHGEALRLLREHGKAPHLDNDRVFVSKTGKRYRYGPAFRAV
jgi:integrase